MDVIIKTFISFLSIWNSIGIDCIPSWICFTSQRMPFVQEELFFQEVGNLKLIQSGKNLSVEKVVSKFDKDRFSAHQSKDHKFLPSVYQSIQFPIHCHQQQQSWRYTFFGHA